MEIPKHTCSFKGGMNKDISPTDYPNTCYYDAQNFRVITDNSEGLTSGNLVTPKGNLASFTLATPTEVLLGWVVLRDYLVLLTTDTAGQLAKPDKIYKVLLTDIVPATDITLSAAVNLVYEANLNFSVDHPIRVVANYESVAIQKIYWVDGLNSLRHLNIVNDPTYNDLTNLDPQLLEILPNHTYGSYELSEQVGGHLKAGRIQYSYQLYSVSGSETMFAPPSNLYNLTTYTISDGIDFVGNEIETEINKAIRVTITFDDVTPGIFNRIRLVALQYERYGDTPTVRVVAEQDLTSSTSVFVDSGNAIGELTLEEFQTIRNDIIPTTIESKNNYLFAGNIKEEYFDIDDLAEKYVDTRAYRWRYVNSGGGGSTAYGSYQLTTTTDPVSAVGYGSYGAYCFGPVGIINMTDTIWRITFDIGAEADITANHPTWTFTGISSIDDTITLKLHNVADDNWTRTLVLSMTGMHIDSYSGGTIIIHGTSYVGDKPSQLVPTYKHVYYDDCVISQTTYTYSYSYLYDTPGSTKYDCVILDGSLTDVFTVDDGTTCNLEVPEDHDCVNVYNNIANDTVAGNDFKYKRPPAAAVPPTIDDLGGTGKYISYEFIYKDETVATQGSITDGSDYNYYLYSISPDVGYEDPQIVLDYTGYQRDEVYRKAITFYDLKGRPCFAKWIADIRFPNVNELLYVDYGGGPELHKLTYIEPEVNDDTYKLCTSTSTDVMSVRILGIKFTIDWASFFTDYPLLAGKLSGFQIIRCIRTDNDSTIKAQGIVLPTHHPKVHYPAVPFIRDGNYSTYNITSADDYVNFGGIAAPQIAYSGGTITGVEDTIDQTLVELISPEIATNKDLIIDSDHDFLEVVGYLDYVTFDAIYYSLHKEASYTVTSTAVQSYNTTPAHLLTDWRRDVKDGFMSFPEAKLPPIHVVGGTGYVARGYDDSDPVPNGGVTRMTYKGTSLVAKIDTPFLQVDPGLGDGQENAMYGRYRRYLGYSAYGGITYEERSYSQYIKAGEFIAVPATPIATGYDTWGGDVYICPFNFMKLFYDTRSEYYDGSTDDHSGQVLVAFPVESKINLNYKLDNIPRYFTIPSDTTLYLIAEKQTIGLTQYPNSYPNISDLYRYNSAYSAENISKTFMPKPFDFRNTKDDDVMVIASERKFNNEYSDSWLIFKYNNYLNLEGRYGAITRLITSGDKILAFQPRGIAVLSILEREVVESTGKAELVIGTGGLLSRYDYISKDSGTTFYYSIVNTEQGIYFYDDHNGKIFRLEQGVEAISDTKGMKSYHEGSTLPRSLISAYDRANREVLFSPTPDINTEVFSGYLDVFLGFFTFGSVVRYVSFDKYLFSSLDNNKFWLHNVGKYNNFYGEEQTSSLTLVANPNKTNVSTFHTVEWMTSITNADVEVPEDTFDTLQMTDSYQDTDIIDVPGSPGIVKRFRKWRLNILRNSEDRGRIRDSWVKTIFKWTQQYGNNRKLVVHPINFSWLPAKLS